MVSPYRRGVDTGRFGMTVLVLMSAPMQGVTSNQFTPPVRDAVRFLPDSTSTQKALYGRITRPKVGVNVYLLTDDSIVEDHPGDESLIVTTWFGGRAEPYTVTDAEKSLLVSAGYTVT